VSHAVDHWDQPDEGHLGDPRRPQEVPVLAAYVLGGDRTGDPAGHRLGLPADLERWRKARAQLDALTSGLSLR
jgi:hypothetical protein